LLKHFTRVDQWVKASSYSGQGKVKKLVSVMDPLWCPVRVRQVFVGEEIPGCGRLVDSGLDEPFTATIKSNQFSLEDRLFNVQVQLQGVPESKIWARINVFKLSR
jgi:hypothetical protein